LASCYPVKKDKKRRVSARRRVRMRVRKRRRKRMRMRVRMRNEEIKNVVMTGNNA
jgi:hypothetical protein